MQIIDTQIPGFPLGAKYVEIVNGQTKGVVTIERTVSHTNPGTGGFDQVIMLSNGRKLTVDKMRQAMSATGLRITISLDQTQTVHLKPLASDDSGVRSKPWWRFW